MSKQLPKHYFINQFKDWISTAIEKNTLPQAIVPVKIYY